MPRRARLSLPGGVFHVISRFARDERRLDRAGAREAYLELLGQAARRSDTQVLAYCLMSNHVHLVVVQGRERLERFTKSLHTGFAAWAHGHARGAKAEGPVFAGRPRTVLVEEETYLLELVRYVHNNPVRAGVARHARGSQWSSHLAYVGRVDAPEWLRTGYVLRRFGRDAARATAAFDAFVDEGRQEGRRPELSGSADAREAAVARRALGDGHRLSDGIVGSEKFVTRVRADAERVEAVLASRGTERRAGAAGRPSVRDVIDASLVCVGVDVVELEAKPRSKRAALVKRLAIWVWVHEYAGAQIDVARALGLDTSVVSRYYGQAIEAAADYDEQATQVTGWLSKRRRPRRSQGGKATDGAIPVRYHVDVDEM